MRRAAPLILFALTVAACQQQRGSVDERVSAADAQDRARQQKAASEMVAQTEDQVRVKMLEQRVSALEAQLAALQGDRTLLDAHLVEQRLNQIEARNADGATAVPAPGQTPTTQPNSTASSNSTARQSATRTPASAATPAARKPLVLDLR